MTIKECTPPPQHDPQTTVPCTDTFHTVHILAGRTASKHLKWNIERIVIRVYITISLSKRYCS